VSDEADTEELGETEDDIEEVVGVGDGVCVGV